MKGTEGILVAGDSKSLCLAAVLPFNKFQIVNALTDLEDDIAAHRKQLARLFKCDELEFGAYTVFEYNNKYTAYSRTLAEELHIDEFDEVVERIKERIKLSANKKD